MAQHDLEWFLGNGEAYDSLTVEQLHVLGQGGTVEYGETATDEAAASVATATPTAESAGTPTGTTENESATSATTGEGDSVLLAKDGKHVIPFSELETARTRNAELEALASQQADLIKELQAAKAADAGTGETTNQDEVMHAFSEQYPELATTLAPVIKQMIDSAVTATRAEMQQTLDAALAPVKQDALDTQVENHFVTITTAVPDFEELRDSGKVEEWVKTLPSFARIGAERVLEEGTASEVIELFSQYKEAAGIKSAPKDEILTKVEIEAKAKGVIDAAKGAKPVSLSDVPAASANTNTEEPTTVEGWSQKFAKMTPEQIMNAL